MVHQACKGQYIIENWTSLYCQKNTTFDTTNIKYMKLQTFFCFRFLISRSSKIKMIKMMIMIMIRMMIAAIHPSSSEPSPLPWELEITCGIGGADSLWCTPSLCTDDGTVVSFVPPITRLKRLVWTMIFTRLKVWFLKNSFWYKMKLTTILPDLIVQFKNSCSATFSSWKTSSQIRFSNKSRLPTASTISLKFSLNLKLIL